MEVRFGGVLLVLCTNFHGRIAGCNPGQTDEYAFPQNRMNVNWHPTCPTHNIMKNISQTPTNAGSQNPTPDQIAVAAYQLYLENGRQDGHDLEHWLSAEKLLTQKAREASQTRVSEPARQSPSRPLETRPNPLDRDGSAGREVTRQQLTPSRPAARQQQWRTERDAQAKRAA
jgi:hypothetical protein